MARIDHNYYIMKKKILINYWNKFYKKKSITAESTFAKKTNKDVKKKSGKKLFPKKVSMNVGKLNKIMKW